MKAPARHRDLQAEARAALRSMGGADEAHAAPSHLGVIGGPVFEVDGQPWAAPASGSARPVRLLDDVAVEQLPAVVYTADDFLVSNGFTVAYGPPGCGKSFFALGLACSVASGRGFAGRAVRRGGVVYVAAEGSAGLGVRLRAWKQHAGYPGRLGVQFHLEPVSLLDPDEVARFLGAVLTLDTRPAVIVLDTFARCLVGGDENSAQDVGRAIAAVDRMRNATGAAVLLLHHTNVSGERERGSTALRGAADTMLALRPAGAGVKVECEKQKDGPAFKAFDLRMHPVAESCVLVTPTGAWEQAARELTRNHLQALESLSRDFLADGATASNWMKASKVPESSFFRTRTDLVRWGYVIEPAKGRGGQYTLTPAGAEAVAPSSQLTPDSLPGSDRNSLPPIPSSKGDGRDGSGTAQDDDAAYLVDERAALERPEDEAA